MLCHLMTRTAISQVSNNMPLISICYLGRSTLDTHISSNIIFMMLYVFSKMIESFLIALHFSVWALTRNTLNVHISSGSPSKQSRLVLSCISKLYHPYPLPSFSPHPITQFQSHSQLIKSLLQHHPTSGIKICMSVLRLSLQSTTDWGA